MGWDCGSILLEVVGTALCGLLDAVLETTLEFNFGMMCGGGKVLIRREIPICFSLQEIVMPQWQNM